MFSSDEELVGLLNSKRRNTAITELHARYGQKVLGFFIRMFHGDVQKAQDFTQDVFLKVMERHHQFNPEGKFYTWLFTIARNMCFTEMRTLSKIQWKSTDEISIAVTQDGELDKEIFRNSVAHEVAQLPKNQRIAFELRYFQELSVKEIATIEDVPEGTVKSRLFHATRKIANELKEFHPKNEQAFKRS